MSARAFRRRTVMDDLLATAELWRPQRQTQVCHKARCHEVFFDRSKNNSRTWFDTAACANALNLRAYRERRKAARFSDLSERDPG